MEKRRKIAIDLDCTINNLFDVWLEKYNKDYDDNLTELPSWEIANYVKSECGDKIFDYLREPGLFSNLDILKDAKEVISFLAKNYDLYIATAYIPETCVDKVNWIKKQKLDIKPRNIIFINNKGLLDVDYLIDDGPHNFKNFKGTGVIMDAKYNQNLKESNDLVRMKNWLEIKEYFESELIVDGLLESTMVKIKKILVDKEKK